ncbi:MAG TPA: ATP-binding protein [Candidatus Babeliales bacterium]|nr:ATP-binding protein [Candidatus Babeliales bacterium]
MNKCITLLLFLLLPVLVLPEQEVQHVSYNSSWSNMWPFSRAAETKFNKHVFLDGWVGELPYELKLLVYQLSQHRSSKKSMIHNRLILHGPPGNGKTTLARNLAKLNAYNFCEYKGSTLVNKFVGSGAQAVEKIFTDAIENSLITDKPTLIFIDEVEQIAANNSTEFRSEHDAALRTLWLNLDQYKNDDRIFFVCATNNYKELHPTFVDRFGTNVVELKNPDKQTRKQVIEHYFSKLAIKLDSTLLDKVSKKTKNLSVRSLEDMTRAVKMKAELENEGIVLDEHIWRVIKTIKKRNSKLSKLYELANNNDKLQKLMSISSSTYYLVSTTAMFGSMLTSTILYLKFKGQQPLRMA